MTAPDRLQWWNALTILDTNWFNHIATVFERFLSCIYLTTGHSDIAVKTSISLSALEPCLRLGCFKLKTRVCPSPLTWSRFAGLSDEILQMKVSCRGRRWYVKDPSLTQPWVLGMGLDLWYVTYIWWFLNLSEIFSKGFKSKQAVYI